MYPLFVTRSLPLDTFVTFRYHVRYQQKGSDMEYFLISVLPYMFLGVVVATVCNVARIGFWPMIGIAVILVFPVKYLIDLGLS